MVDGIGLEPILPVLGTRVLTLELSIQGTKKPGSGRVG